MAGFLHEHAGSVFMSVLLHGLLACALLLMSQLSITPPQRLQSVPIDAVVMDSQVLQGAQRALAQRAQQELARAAAAAQAETAAAAAAAADIAAKATKTAVTEAAAEAAAETVAEAASRADSQRAADLRKSAEAQRAAQRRTQDAQQAAAAHAAQAKQAVQAKQEVQAKQAQAAAKQAVDQHARGEREAELRRQLAEEEHVSALEGGPLRDRYAASLRNSIQKAWIKPDSARVGVDCLVEVTQVPGGVVTGAHVMQCNGDAAVRQSIENAVYRASPLPDPPDPALFQKNFAFRFKPNE